MLRGAAVLLLAATSSIGCDSSSSPHDESSGPPPMGLYCPMGVAYRDADGDEIGLTDDTVECAHDRAPVGYAIYGGDCDDSDPSVFTKYYRDVDGDGFSGEAETTCAAGETPEGYRLSPGEDCDDTDAALSRWYALNDLDGDGQTLCTTDLEVVCGSPDVVPAGASTTTTCPGDCDDSDPEASWLHYEDLDGDGFGSNSGVTVCAGPQAPPGYGVWFAGAPDCDDTRADVNQFALEQWSDSVDSDCDGFSSPYGCDDQSCEPESSPLIVDMACSSADLLISVQYVIECFHIEWTVAVGNQGSSAATGFTLTIEGEAEPIVYAVQDPLEPGAQHSYPLPQRTLQGELTFTVTAEGADCNPDNNVVTEVQLPRDCAL